MEKKKLLRVGAIALCCAIAIGTVSVFALSGTNGSGSGEDAVPTQQINVYAEKPSLGTIAVPGEYIGKLEPGDFVYVIPKAGGEVKAVHFNVGDTVEAGDVLFSIDDSTMRSAVEQSVAALANAEAKLALSKEMAQQGLDTLQDGLATGTNASVIQAEAAVKTAENAVERATAGLATLRRAQREHRELDEALYTPNAVTGLTYDDASEYYRTQVLQAELSVEAANLGLAQAKDMLRATQSGMDSQTVAAQNSVKMAELNANLNSEYISLQKLQNDLKNFNVAAPIGGVIEQCNVDVFGMASPSSPAFVISNKESMTVTFKVPEANLEALKLGDAVKIEKNGKTYGAVVSEITTMADPATGLFQIKAEAEGASDLLSGTTVKVIMDARKSENCIIVPIDAVNYDRGQSFVYIAVGDTAKKAFVTTGISSGDMIEILSGLTLSDQVIITWSSHLTDGAQITLIDEEAAA